MKKLASAVAFLCLASIAAAVLAPAAAAQESLPVTSVLRQPLPPEDLSCEVAGTRIVVRGPTFEYAVDRATGAIAAIQVRRQDRTVISLHQSDVTIGGRRLGSATGSTQVASQGKEKVVLKTEGRMPGPSEGPDLRYVLQSTFFNDGVVVCEIELLPGKDIPVDSAIGHELIADGRFDRYLHKNRDHHSPHTRTPAPALPKSGNSVRFNGLTSCLQAFSHDAGLAIFTDCGATHLSGQGAASAVLESLPGRGDGVRLRLAQYIVHVAKGGEPYVLKAGEPFRFRYGISVVPNRLPHPRWRDLRMFAWIGDAKNPYPTDEEILQVARLGFTLFQMHRLGTPGEPRQPAGEAERVIRKVHEAGMLFLWTANADLMYASAPGVARLREQGKWSLWQGFNFGGRYTAEMDPYCDLLATCLASPNGLAEYRVQTLRNMMERYDVDGMYIDDNLAYSECTLWKEHGHPRPVYDCLIELHEMNWRRRQVLRERCPHVVLIDHCTTAVVQPVICSFDAHLYAEGYSFDSLAAYWNHFGSLKNAWTQGFIWSGDSETGLCPAATAYNFDLLTGGGQYCYIDWRLYPEKFPYAHGVHKEEPVYLRKYNLPQYYFGMYESTPHYFDSKAFSTTAPDTHAAVYHNRVWGDYLVAVANLAAEGRTTSLEFRALDLLGLSDGQTYLLYDVHSRVSRTLDGAWLAGGIREIAVPAEGLRLFCLRKLPAGRPFHLWGGKRLRETWDDQAGKLTVTLLGPPGLTETVVIGRGGQEIGKARLDGKLIEWSLDAASGLAHATVTFTGQPATLEIAIEQLAANFRPTLPLATSGHHR